MIFNVALFALLFAVTTPKNDRTPPIEPNPPVVDLLAQETNCLTEVVYYEAPNESYEGKLAVATVVMNRVKSKSFPSSICGVVYQRNPRGCQFSWVCMPRPKHGTAAFKAATTVAQDVLKNGTRLGSIRNAMFFHNTTMTPYWAESMTFIQQIGNHLFYATKNKKEAGNS
jgi:spore germination cell wall hydrolase CwlJ-like protein